MEIDAEKTKYVYMFHYQTEGQIHCIKIANKSLENVAKLKYLGIIVTNYNCIHKEVKKILNLGNACYNSFHCLWSCCLLLKNL